MPPPPKKKIKELLEQLSEILLIMWDVKEEHNDRVKKITQLSTVTVQRTGRRPKWYGRIMSV